MPAEFKQTMMTDALLWIPRFLKDVSVWSLGFLWRQEDTMRYSQSSNQAQQRPEQDIVKSPEECGMTASLRLRKSSREKINSDIKYVQVTSRPNKMNDFGSTESRLMRDTCDTPAPANLTRSSTTITKHKERPSAATKDLLHSKKADSQSSDQAQQRPEPEIVKSQKECGMTASLRLGKYSREKINSDIKYAQVTSRPNNMNDFGSTESWLMRDTCDTPAPANLTRSSTTITKNKERSSAATKDLLHSKKADSQSSDQAQQRPEPEIVKSQKECGMTASLRLGKYSREKINSDIKYAQVTSRPNKMNDFGSTESWLMRDTCDTPAPANLTRCSTTITKHKERSSAATKDFLHTKKVADTCSLVPVPCTRKNFNTIIHSMDEPPKPKHEEDFTKFQARTESMKPTQPRCSVLQNYKISTDNAGTLGSPRLTNGSRETLISKGPVTYGYRQNIWDANQITSVDRQTQFTLQNQTKQSIKTVNVKTSNTIINSVKDVPPSRKKKNYNKITYEFIWKPHINTSTYRPNRRSYNSSRRYRYKNTDLDSGNLDVIQQFYEERATVDITSKNETQENIDYILGNILKSIGNRRRFHKWADPEGSVAVGLKVGKADESDHSVDILVNCGEITWSNEPFMVEFEDDIDSNFMTELSTVFVDAGKRFFPDERRKLYRSKDPCEVPNGFVAVSIGEDDASKFKDCCINRNGSRTWLLPYLLLSAFHRFVGNAVQAQDYVTLNKGVKGPAVTLTVLQEGGPNVSVDITLKLTLPLETLSVWDFGWPRNDTKKWLTEEKIDAITSTELYLVPKGDKYWKVSFANCEYELLNDIDINRTWRKGCLRIMKKKFMHWQSQSQSGFKGLSSYLLKTTLLWLCEILPDDEYWYRDQLANRYLNFLQEFDHRLMKGFIGEYFNPSVNLLETKDDRYIKELREFVQEEISMFYY